MKIAVFKVTLGLGSNELSEFDMEHALAAIDDLNLDDVIAATVKAHIETRMALKGVSVDVEG